MDFNLLVSAQPLRLAPNLRTTPVVDGTMMVKNTATKTYLRVTPMQWEVVRHFAEPLLVPAALDRLIRGRLSPPLGEFYELILKAERAKILVPPAQEIPEVAACDWRGSLDPQFLARPLGALLLVGLVLSLGFRPELPSSMFGALAGAVIFCGAASLAEYLRACLICGAGGEVFHPRWLWSSLPPRFDIDASDVVMLSRKVQDAVLLAEPALLAAAAGITTWNKPEWCFIPLLGLIYNLRPILGGRFPSLLRLGQENTPSDAEQEFLFPPNRTPRARWRMLTRGLRQLNTWVRVSYGVVWTLMVVYLAARLTDSPPWTLAFWEANGPRVALAITGSLLCLGLAYAIWELFLRARHRGSAWRHAFREWRARWFRSGQVQLDEAGRLTAFGGAPLLRALDPEQQKQLARAMEPVWHGPWKKLPEYEPATSPKVALILSGRLVVHREENTTRKRRVQVLGPGDMLGLHGIADPAGGAYRLRTNSPVALLEADRALTTELILGRVVASSFGNAVLKVPFLRTIPLCRNWHLQAVQRFAQLAALTSYPEGDVICCEGQSVESFFIVFAGDAVVTREKRPVGVVRVGEFFGEIGLLQNSTANATITARRHTRCLVIARTEFIRFVTHNYTVALELERVSSRRLGRPIFPVRQNQLRAS